MSGQIRAPVGKPLVVRTSGAVERSQAARTGRNLLKRVDLPLTLSLSLKAIDGGISLTRGFGPG